MLIQHNPNEGLKLQEFNCVVAGDVAVLIQHNPNEGLKPLLRVLF